MCCLTDAREVRIIESGKDSDRKRLFPDAGAWFGPGFEESRGLCGVCGGVMVLVGVVGGWRLRAGVVCGGLAHFTIGSFSIFDEARLLLSNAAER